LEDFEFTGNEEHYIRAKDLKQWIKERDLKITDTKLGMELGKYVRANGLNVVNKPKKLNGKTQTCWIGMKWITETEEIEEH